MLETLPRGPAERPWPAWSTTKLAYPERVSRSATCRYRPPCSCSPCTRTTTPTGASTVHACQYSPEGSVPSVCAVVGSSVPGPVIAGSPPSDVGIRCILADGGDGPPTGPYPLLAMAGPPGPRHVVDTQAARVFTTGAVTGGRLLLVDNQFDETPPSRDAEVVALPPRRRPAAGPGWSH